MGRYLCIHPEGWYHHPLQQLLVSGVLSNFAGQPGRAQTACLVTCIRRLANVMDPPCLLLLVVSFTLALLLLDLNWQAPASICLDCKKRTLFLPGVLYGLIASEKSVTMWSGFAGMFTDAGGILHVGAMCVFVASNMLTQLPQQLVPFVVDEIIPWVLACYWLPASRTSCWSYHQPSSGVLSFWFLFLKT